MSAFELLLLIRQFLEANLWETFWWSVAFLFLVASLLALWQATFGRYMTFEEVFHEPKDDCDCAWPELRTTL